MNQSDMILLYMHRNGSITQMESEKAFGCYRLAARISDLKDAGVPISTAIETGVNRFGKRMRYARYSLADPGVMAERIAAAERKARDEYPKRLPDTQ